MRALAQQEQLEEQKEKENDSSRANNGLPKSHVIVSLDGDTNLDDQVLDKYSAAFQGDDKFCFSNQPGDDFGINPTEPNMRVSVVSSVNNIDDDDTESILTENDVNSASVKSISMHKSRR